MRKFYSLAATTILALFLFAQPLAAQGLGIGVEAGLNVSDLSVSDGGDGTELDAETGYRAGAVLRYDFGGGILGFQTGASVSQKGASSDAAGGLSEISLDYLEVPFLLQLNIPTGPAPVTPRLFAGGTANFELSCDVTDVGGTATQCQAADIPNLDIDPKSADLGLLFGGGLDFPAGPGALTVDVRFDLGLSDINDVAETAVQDPVELKNRTFQATAGYVLSL